jgi:hypothetical protein
MGWAINVCRSFFSISRIFDEFDVQNLKSFLHSL